MFRTVTDTAAQHSVAAQQQQQRTVPAMMETTSRLSQAVQELTKTTSQKTAELQVALQKVADLNKEKEHQRLSLIDQQASETKKIKELK